MLDGQFQGFFLSAFVLEGLTGGAHRAQAWRVKVGLCEVLSILPGLQSLELDK